MLAAPADESRVRAATTWWHLALARPALLAAHLANYGALMAEEAELALGLVRQRALLLLSGIICALAGLLLAGMALMLWASLPGANAIQPWVLVGVPLLPLVGAMLALRGWARSPPIPLWPALQEQIAADAALLHRHEP